MTDNLDEELIHPHCGNQALHLAEYCLATIHTFEVVADNPTPPMLAAKVQLDEARVSLTLACLRMLIVACDDRELAESILSEAMLTGLTLHEAWSNRLDPSHQN